MDLDNLYGKARGPAKPIKAPELVYPPKSVQKLDPDSAVWLKQYLCCEHDLRAIGLLPKFAHMLWIMDTHGDIYFAVEEMIDDVGNLIGVLPKSISARPERMTKLGHPSLIPHAQKLARIGGELVYDPLDETAPFRPMTTA